jgi:anti-sigma factor RsiW
MSCDVIERGDLEGYAFGELSPRAALQVEGHLFGCATCASELRLLRAERRLFRSRAEAAAPEVPSFEGVLVRIAQEPRAPGEAREERKGHEGRPTERIQPVRYGRLTAALGVLAAAAAVAWLWSGRPQKPAELQAGNEDAFAAIVSEAVCLRDAPEHEEEEEARAAASEEALASVDLAPQSRMSGAVAQVEADLGACSSARASEACGASDALITPACEVAVAWCSVGRP